MNRVHSLSLAFAVLATPSALAQTQYEIKMSGVFDGGSDPDIDDGDTYDMTLVVDEADALVSSSTVRWETYVSFELLVNGNPYGGTTPPACAQIQGDRIDIDRTANFIMFRDTAPSTGFNSNLFLPGSPPTAVGPIPQPSDILLWDGMDHVLGVTATSTVGATGARNPLDPRAGLRK